MLVIDWSRRASVWLSLAESQIVFLCVEPPFRVCRSRMHQTSRAAASLWFGSTAYTVYQSPSASCPWSPKEVGRLGCRWDKVESWDLGQDSFGPDRPDFSSCVYYVGAGYRVLQLCATASDFTLIEGSTSQGATNSEVWPRHGTRGDLWA